MRSLAFLSILAAAACAVDPAEPPSMEPPSVEPVAKQSVNSLDENAIAAFAYDLNRLVNQPFEDSPVMRSLAASKQGLQLVEYSARCTLALGVQVPIQTYDGPAKVPTAPSLGLAPDWRKRGLGPEEQQWLMSCLLAHINAGGNAVVISARGPHAALATTPAEVARFTYLEGAFYGRFGDPTDPDEGGLTYQRACWGPALAKCGGAAPTILYDRLCTIPGGCPHLVVVGPCEATPPAPAACAPRTGDAYDVCYPIAISGPPPSMKYKAAITTYLEDFACPM